MALESKHNPLFEAETPLTAIISSFEANIDAPMRRCADPP